MLEKPEVWGAQELSSKEVTMRIVAKTAPMRQWEVARELRARVKSALDAAGIAPAGPDTIVITAPPDQGSATGRGSPAAGRELATRPQAAAGPETAESLADTAAEDPPAAAELPADADAAGTPEDESARPPA
jgi:small conductance mechanosensitive channel